MEQYRFLDIDVGGYVEALVDWITINLQVLLDGIADVISFLISILEGAFLDTEPMIIALLLLIIGVWRVGIAFGVFCVVSVLLIFEMGLWIPTMATLALVLASSLVALVVGIPIGIAMARSGVVDRIVRPILDFMQTMPAFVYLIPAVIFFGLGTVPGAIATVVFAMPPVVRLTNLGIRQVSQENVEAGLAFGCTQRQLLLKVQMPLAMPSIMQGINQTIMLALSMVVIASMIGAGGLGDTVLTGIQRLNVGMGFEGGLAVVLLAILLDRITQTFGQRGRQPRNLVQRMVAALIARKPTA